MNAEGLPHVRGPSRSTSGMYNSSNKGVLVAPATSMRTLYFSYDYHRVPISGLRVTTENPCAFQEKGGKTSGEWMFPKIFWGTYMWF